MKVIRFFYGLILIALVLSSVGIPKNFNIGNKTPIKAISANSCLDGGQSGKFNQNFCCAGTYAVELTSSSQGKDFICLDMEEYPLAS